MSYAKVDRVIGDFVSELIENFKDNTEVWNDYKDYYVNPEDEKDDAFFCEYSEWKYHLAIYTDDMIGIVEEHGAAIITLMSFVENPNDGIDREYDDVADYLTHYLNLAIDVLFEDNIGGFYDKLKSVFFEEEAA